MSWLTTDFPTIFNKDFGVSATLKLLSSETIDPSTGQKTKIEIEVLATIVPASVSVADIQMNPALVKSASGAFFISEENAAVKKGDTIEIDSEIWTIVETKKIQGITKAFVRKA